MLSQFWPKIVGELKREEVALVLEIFHPKKSPAGAKIYTQKKETGWISAKHLLKIND